MKLRTRTVALVGLTCVVVAIPATADAKTKTVAMGLPSKNTGKKFQKLGADVNDFFPHGVTIHVGDRVRFVPAGFHTVEIPAKGAAVTPLISPTGQKVSGSTDAAGNAFWFNGQDQLGFSPALLPPGSFGKHLRYNGHKTIESGLPIAPKLKPMTVRFTKAGRYTYFCNVHPGMKGTVRVRPHSKRIPTRKQDARRLKRQVKRDLKIAKRVGKTIPPAHTIDVGAAGPHGVEVYAMFPRGSVTVHVGDTLNFRMSPGSREDHTATFGPGNPLTEPNSYLGQIAGSFEAPVIDPRGVYPSEQPPTQATLTTLLHGNGFWNSGVMDRSKATPLPSFNSVKFGQPGDYQFYCLIHPFMHGTIHVVAP